MISLTHYIVVSLILFSSGLVAILSRKNMVGIFLGIELILLATALNFVAFAKYTSGTITGHVASLFVLVMAGSSVVVGFALVYKFYFATGSVCVDELKELKG